MRTDATPRNHARRWRKIGPYSLTVLAALLFAVPNLFGASARAVNQVPEVNHAFVVAYELDDRSAEYTPVESGGTIVVEPGIKLTLRMQGRRLRNNPDRRTSYPATLFTPVRNGNVIDPVRTSPEQGSFTFIARDPANGSNRQAVDFEITERNLRIEDSTRRGRIWIEVASDEPDPAPAPTPDRGATLYRDSGFQGRSMRVTSDVRDLGPTALGNDQLSSIQVDRGCVVRIFEDTNFRGDYEEIEFDLGDFSRSRIGNDQASSLQIECQRGRRGVRDDGGFAGDRDRDRRDFRRGAMLFEDTDFRGASAFFGDGGYDDLGRTQIGNDRASSVTVSRGCVAVLYRDSDFRGEAIEVDGDVSRLAETRVGNDSVSSVRVICR